MAGVEIFADRRSLTNAAAALVVARAAESVATRGRFLWALSGGSTPRDLYATLAGPEWRDRINWTDVHVFWGDERAVPPEHPHSNYRMACEALLDHVPIPVAHVHRIVADGDLAVRASEYEHTLRSWLDSRAESPRGTHTFDLALLGLGADGHTASLFPDSMAARERERWVVAEHVDVERGWRITLTPPVLNAAAAVVFLVAGADKADALTGVLEGPPAPDALPAQRIASAGSRVRWMVDGPAARRLTTVSTGL